MTLRDAFMPREQVVVCDLCAFLALASECRDCRSISHELGKVCSFCCDELASAEDAAFDAVCAGACCCPRCC